MFGPTFVEPESGLKEGLETGLLHLNSASLSKSNKPTSGKANSPTKRVR